MTLSDVSVSEHSTHPGAKNGVPACPEFFANDIYGGIHTGIADYYSADYCLHEYGEDEDGVIIEEFLVYASQIDSIEEIGVHGTVELRTGRMALRRYRPEDADELYKYFGSDPAMWQYTGWNPYETPEMARETVRSFIDRYQDEHFYGWVLDVDGVVWGTFGAYDYHDGTIEVGFSIARVCWGRGCATEALKRVLSYLTDNEGIPCVTAWCAAENIASRRVLEKAGMHLVRTECGGLSVGNRTYDKLIYEYRGAK